MECKDSFLRGTDGRGRVNPGRHLNSATGSLRHLYCARLLIWQIFTGHLLGARSWALGVAFLPVHTAEPGPESLLGWINFPTSLHVYLSSDARYVPRSPASYFLTRSLPHDAPFYYILGTRHPTPLVPKLIFHHPKIIKPTRVLCLPSFLPILPVPLTFTTSAAHWADHPLRCLDPEWLVPFFIHPTFPTSFIR